MSTKSSNEQDDSTIVMEIEMDANYRPYVVHGGQLVAVICGINVKKNHLRNRSFKDD
jgi:hypothetical protein